MHFLYSCCSLLRKGASMEQILTSLSSLLLLLKRKKSKRGQGRGKGRVCMQEFEGLCWFILHAWIHSSLLFTLSWEWFLITLCLMGAYLAFFTLVNIIIWSDELLCIKYRFIIVLSVDNFLFVHSSRASQLILVVHCGFTYFSLTYLQRHKPPQSCQNIAETLENSTKLTSLKNTERKDVSSFHTKKPISNLW